MADILEVFVTFLSGIVSGLIIQETRFKYSLRRGKINRLLPYLESAYPIVERLGQHSKYAANMQLQNDLNETSRILAKVTLSLYEYSKWFDSLKEDGMIPELDYIDRDLLDYLGGLFNYAFLCKVRGLAYLSEQIQNLAKHCLICQNYLEHRLSR